MLAKAKELNWCVHELEREKVYLLQHKMNWEFDEKLKKMGRRRRDGSLSRCVICQPPLNGS